MDEKKNPKPMEIKDRPLPGITLDDLRPSQLVNRKPEQPMEF